MTLQTVLRISGVLPLLLLALFGAISLEPVVTRLARRRPGRGPAVIGGLLGAGHIVFSAVTGTPLVIVVTVYLMVGMEQLKHFAYRFVPLSRRAGVVDLSERILLRVGRYMPGNVIT
ncbi:hypothetical protein AB0C81_17930 [Streptomyces roseoverticillatus]|uniref:hypothetical protein n=1 Tax=Streptomyces roseoverticillatus TaxID=66429 RepID=UPI0033EEE2B7